MPIAVENLSGQLSSQHELLLKAGAEIETGRHRVAAQERLLSNLQAAGRNTAAAERLSDLLKRLLAEWERRHDSIAQRIAYLENLGRRASPGAD